MYNKKNKWTHTISQPKAKEENVWLIAMHYIDYRTRENNSFYNRFFIDSDDVAPKNCQIVKWCVKIKVTDKAKTSVVIYEEREFRWHAKRHESYKCKLFKASAWVCIHFTVKHTRDGYIGTRNKRCILVVNLIDLFYIPIRVHYPRFQIHTMLTFVWFPSNRLGNSYSLVVCKLIL